MFICRRFTTKMGCWCGGNCTPDVCHDARDIQTRRTDGRVWSGVLVQVGPLGDGANVIASDGPKGVGARTVGICPLVVAGLADP